LRFGGGAGRGSWFFVVEIFERTFGGLDEG